MEDIKQKAILFLRKKGILQEDCTQFVISWEENEKKVDVVEVLIEFFGEIKNWEIEKTDRYYYLSGRYSKTYIEVTFWYNKYTFERKETQRNETISDGQEHQLPIWCRSCEYRRSLNYE